MQLAGMALRNGVLVLGPTSWAVAVRLEDGTIRTTARQRPNEGEDFSRRVPFLRGPLRLANMLRVLPELRRHEPAARFGFESRPMLAGMVLGSAAATKIRRASPSAAAGELVAGVTSLAITLGTMRSGEVAAYHGAEHKAIGGYEQDIEAADAPREHPRCGTQLAVPMLVFSSIATQAALALMPGSPRTARAAGQLVGIASATELFRAGSRGQGTALAQAAAKAGLALQTHATTVEPSREQLDVAEAALAALLDAEAAA